MAMENERVTAEVIEATEFPQRARAHGVRGVPKTVINDGAAEFVGALPERAQIEAVLKAAGADGT